MKVKDSEIVQFANTGLLHLRGVITKNELVRTKEFVFNELKKSGSYRDNKCNRHIIAAFKSPLNMRS